MTLVDGLPIQDIDDWSTTAKELLKLFGTDDMATVERIDIVRQDLLAGPLAQEVADLAKACKLRVEIFVTAAAIAAVRGTEYLGSLTGFLEQKYQKLERLRDHLAIAEYEYRKSRSAP
ncbi:MAG TPA: hypothetical protein VG753_00310 [Candidatus Paceibacterota bacterium]|nr:hypothetical protein [Candidatus Paceibacterota bacterium]